MQWELHPKPPPQLWHIKSTLHLWHFFLQGFDPHYTTCTLYTASVFFSIHTKYSCLGIYQQREMYKLTDSRTDSSSSAAVENKITNFHQSCRKATTSANTTAAIPVSSWKMQKVPKSCLLTQHTAAPESPREKTRFPKSQNISVLLCSSFCYSSSSSFFFF